MPLNQQQLAAARAAHDAPLKIIAGAGTGKTETLAARYVELVRRGVPPARIVLLTFTEDAAAEMRARVMLRLRESGLSLSPHALLDLWIATFHGFAMRLLRQHGFHVGLPPTPRLLTDDEQAEWRARFREQVEGALRLPNGYAPLDHTLYRWDTEETWNRVLHVFDALRRGGGTPAELTPHPALADQQLELYAAHRAQLVPLIEHCFAEYVSHLRRRGLLDYNELLLAARRLMAAAPTICQRFDVVMVDEFQDTNRPQLELLRQAQPSFARVTVVGDPRQAIYGWNSARAELIVQFPFRQPPEAPGTEHPLSENYRSDPAIIEVANLALHGSELERYAALRAATGRLSRRVAALQDAPVVSLHLFGTIEQEARWIAAEIRRLRDRGVACRDLAILHRSRAAQPALIAALREQGVPFTIRGGTGFYLHPLVRLTSSLLRLIGDPGDRAAWAHLLESPLIGLPPAVIATRAPHADGQRMPVFDRWLADPEALPTAMPGRAAAVARLTAFRSLLEAARLRWGLLAPADYLEWLWQASGALHEARNASDPSDRLILRRLLRDADEYAATRPAGGIAGFAALLQERIATQPRVPLPTPAAPDAVEITTVHGAKGREWPIIFVWHTSLPSKRAGEVERVLWDEHWKLVISDSDGRRRDDPLRQLRADLRRRQRNEERSIWYVALTRAQERLYVTHSGCDLDGDLFADARTKEERAAQGQPATDDDAIHFFHELWNRLMSHPERQRGALACRVEPSGGP